MRFERRSDGLWAFFALACGITWALDAPLAGAWLSHREPSPSALGMAGLGAFGPTLAALAVAAPRGEVREVFGRWRTDPRWPLLGLFAAPLLYLWSTWLCWLLGGEPSRWLYLPDAPERIAALAFFSVGEELGWRGFAQPRVARRWGPTVGPLVLGGVWALWHLGMLVTPDGRVDWVNAAFLLAILPPWSAIYSWFAARSGGSLAVAIAIHAGGHLDNQGRAPPSEIGLRVVTALVVVAAAALAARSLARDPGRAPSAAIGR